MPDLKHSGADQCHIGGRPTDRGHGFAGVMRVMHEEDPPHRAIRSFVLRAGRTTTGQQRALEQLWPDYGREFDAASPPRPEELFPHGTRRVIEIGFGNGEHLAELAAARRADAFLGIEVHRPGVGHLLIHARRNTLTNLRVICHDAVEVLAAMPRGSLDEVLLLFPDPWPKTRHHKRRLVQPAFVTLLAERLVPGGLVHMATDWEHYAQQMLDVLDGCALLTNTAAGGGFVMPAAARSPTRFERRGTRLGHEVRELVYRRVTTEAR